MAISILGVVLTGCYFGNPSGPTVGVVGHSITYDSATDIQNTLGVSYRVDVNGQPGDTIAQQIPAVERMEAKDSPPPVDWILNLGTNGTIENNTSWQTDYDEMLSFVAGAQCVVLVSISTNADGIGEADFGWTDDTVAQQINAYIVELVASDRSHYEWIDWNDLIQLNPGWLQADGLHPNAVGDQELADWYNLALSVCP